MDQAPNHLDATVNVSFTHRVRFASDAWAMDDTSVSDVIQAVPGRPARVLVIVDRGVSSRDPTVVGRIGRYLSRQKHIASAGTVYQIEGGESIKAGTAPLMAIFARMHESKLDRHDYVLAVGGGAMLDAVGMAAALYHRGIRLIRIPTTTLAQADSGVGVKTSINLLGEKNLLGTFSPPWAVICDHRSLVTLSRRDWPAGFAEVAKVALLKDPAMFDDLEQHARAIRERQMDVAIDLTQRSAQHHFNHIVQGDPFERTTARPLDFGHWAAHRLEMMTNHRLRHGEAVAIGLALDLTYAAITNLLDHGVVNRAIRVLRTLGLPTVDHAMEDTTRLLGGIEAFREHLGGPLTLTHIKGIGEPVEIHEVDEQAMRAAINHRLATLKSPDPSASSPTSMLPPTIT